MTITHLTVQKIQADWLTNNDLTLDVLRADEIHPLLSGNKWFKLQYYLKDALQLKKDAVATFGGAWSNHIIATAYACRQKGINSIGIIRGETPATLSTTLLLAKSYGMELHFVSRQQYRNKLEIEESFYKQNYYWIPEGGYGLLGAQGAADMLQYVDQQSFTNIVAAVGTGTMLAGLTTASAKHQKITGISSLKGNFDLEKQVATLLSKQHIARFEIIHDYHFGGYGKVTSGINSLYERSLYKAQPTA